MGLDLLGSRASWDVPVPGRGCRARGFLGRLLMGTQSREVLWPSCWAVRREQMTGRLAA